MKKFFSFLILAAASTTLMVSCFNANRDFLPSNGEAYIYPDPDSYLLSINTTDAGDCIWNYGERDAQGLPKKITEFAVWGANDSGPTSVLLNDNGSISRIQADNGVTLTFDWVSKTSATVTVIDESTGEQLNTLVDFAESKAAPFSDGPFKKRSGEAFLTVEDIEPSDPVTPDTKATYKKEGILTVARCGSPVNKTCWVEAYESNDKSVIYGNGTQVKRIEELTSLGTYKATKIETGKYKYSLNFEYKSIEDMEPYIAKLGVCMNVVCTGMSSPYVAATLCPGISAAIAAMGVGLSTPAAGAFMAACTAGVAAVSLYCNTAGQTGVPGDVTGVYDDVGSVFAKAVVKCLGYTDAKKIVLKPRALNIPNDIYGDRVTITTQDELPTLSVSLGDDPIIADFITEPSSPAEYQGYDAKATLNCMPEGAIVVMTIVGTDGYDKTISYTFTETMMNKVVTMYVPGAEKNVRDKVTVAVELPNGVLLQRTVSLVFG